MKILSYLNVSNISNLEADSGLVFQRALLLSIIRVLPEVEIYLICPEMTPHIDDKIIRLKLDDSSLNKYSVRFNFPWDCLLEQKNIFKEIDFAIINQPELTSNFRSFFQCIGNINVKLLTYFHYVPIEKLPKNGRIYYTENLNHGGLADIIFKRQLESSTVADYCITCSEFATYFIKENASILNQSIELESIAPPISLKDVIENKVDGMFPIKTLVYNHRLYEHYGTKKIFEWLEELYSKRTDFTVLVTDPTAERSLERHLLDESVNNFKEKLTKLPFIKIKNFNNRAEYYQTLWKSHAGIAPLKPSALWSMGVVDLLACGKPVLSPNYACFPEIIGNYEPLLYKNKEDFFEKIENILDNKEVYFSAVEYCKKEILQYDEQQTSSKFLKLFSKLGYNLDRNKMDMV